MTGHLGEGEKDRPGIRRHTRVGSPVPLGASATARTAPRRRRAYMPSEERPARQWRHTCDAYVDSSAHPSKAARLVGGASTFYYSDDSGRRLKRREAMSDPKN
jgi:hypothetical protein